MKKLKVLLSVLTIAAISGSVAPSVFAEDTAVETSGENESISNENTVDESSSNEEEAVDEVVTEENKGQISVFAAGDEVSTPDEALKAALNGLISSSRSADAPLTEGELGAISGKIDLSGLGIEDISGIEYLENVTDIKLRDNIISDITPLASLTQLTGVDVTFNIITDFRPLQALTNLTTLAIIDQYMYYTISEFDGTAAAEFIAPDGTVMPPVYITNDGEFDSDTNTISWSGLEQSSSVEYYVSYRVTLNGINTIFNGAQEIRYTKFVEQKAVEPSTSEESNSTGTTNSTLPNTGENNVEFVLAGTALAAVATVILVRRKK